MYDVIVIGGGAAGLSAALNAASEGLRTLVLDSAEQFGGQAGSSTLIENYAGFASGVTGEALTASMIAQCRKFKAELLAPVRAESIDTVDGHLVVMTDDGRPLHSKAVILATGVQYRRVNAEGLTEYLGRGVSYGSPSLSDDYSGKSVFVIGGANSAGQAALHLSKKDTCSVNILIRGNDIRAKMSEYLVDRIEKRENIRVYTGCEIKRVYGNSSVNAVRLTTGVKMRADKIFVLVGATPKVYWLDDDIERDEHGFIKTGNDIDASFIKIYGRLPFAHESSLAGLFVAGDIRSGSVKRCASAVGEGAVTVSEVHQYLGGIS